MEPFIGMIVAFGGNFNPRGWAFCDGSLISISSNQALFSILGTIYGGDGRTTFALPDLRGRVPVHKGQGPGLNNISLGQKGGSQLPTLPAHTHTATLHAETAVASIGNPTNRLLAATQTAIYADAVPADEIAMHADSITLTSTGSAVGAYDNYPPFQAINFIIALQGIYPSRN